MNMDENSMAYVHLAKDDLLGSYQWKGGLDLLNIVLIVYANTGSAFSMIASTSITLFSTISAICSDV